jgi:GntR family transcriptional regulator/MocR family aminotransferase
MQLREASAASGDGHRGTVHADDPALRATSTSDPRSTSGPTLQLALDPRAGRRAALEAALREAIRGGRLPAGSRLPSTRALALDLGLARGTVVEAYAQLVAEGYLEARHGSGTRVADVAGAPSGARRRASPAPPAPAFDFDPSLPDLAAFPRAAWTAALRRGLRRAPAASLAYDDPRGRRELREALADYELVVVCAVFRHGLSLLLRTLRAGGARTVAMEDPCLPLHRAVAAAAGLAVRAAPVDADGVEPTRAGDASGLVVSPAHQFPLGVVLAPERRAAAVSFARARDALVIEDDYDAELRYDRQPIGALQALDPGRVAYGGTASKTLVPGLRLGWLVVPPARLDAVLALRRTEDAHTSATDQIALAELLSGGGYERHVRRMRAVYRGRRDRLLELLARRAPAVAARGTAAGLRVLVELPAGGPSAADVAALAARRGVAIPTLAPYHHDGVAAREALVVGYAALPDHAFAAALEALGDLLAEALSSAGPKANPA